MVRRTRSFIQANYATTDPATGRKFLKFEDGTRSYFPERVPKTVKFRIDEKNAVAAVREHVALNEIELGRVLERDRRAVGHQSVSFDAIAFTRSLHHINPLGEAIARARELLNRKGLLLIEDFALDEVDETTVDWFVKVLRSKQAKALINPIADQLATELLSASDVMQTWRHSRAHDVHSFPAMKEAIAAHFVVRKIQSVPYFYRYLIPVLTDTLEAASFVRKVFQQEIILGNRGEIVLLGRRIVASP